MQFGGGKGFQGISHSWSLESLEWGGVFGVHGWVEFRGGERF